jgi:hypothetical protein
VRLSTKHPLTWTLWNCAMTPCIERGCVTTQTSIVKMMCYSWKLPRNPFYWDWSYHPLSSYGSYENLDLLAEWNPLPCPSNRTKPL